MNKENIIGSILMILLLIFIFGGIFLVASGIDYVRDNGMRPIVNKVWCGKEKCEQ